MVERLLISGICIIPFYELLVKLLPFTIVTAGDTREAKSFLALFFCIACFFLNKEVMKHKSLGFIFLLIYVFFASHLWWKMPLIMNDVNVGGFYKWQPLLYCLSFYLLFLTVSTAHLDKDKILNYLLGTTVIMAGYVVLQALGFDQFFNLIKAGYVDSIGNTAKLVGNLGQPTLVSPFIALGCPLAMRYKKYWILGLLVPAVVITGSFVAITALGIGILYYLLSYNKKLAKYAVISVLVLATGAIIISKKPMTGREIVWPETLQDIKTTPFDNADGQKFVFTGVGLGSFPFLYHSKHQHQTNFLQVHNEYLEWFYSTGLIGLILLLGCIYEVFRMSQDTTLTSVLIIICVVAGGTFIWQLGIYQYITAIIVGLIYGEKNEKDFMGSVPGVN